LVNPLKATEGHPAEDNPLPAAEQIQCHELRSCQELGVLQQGLLVLYMKPARVQSGPNKETLQPGHPMKRRFISSTGVDY
jgi:hypothetical protein